MAPKRKTQEVEEAEAHLHRLVEREAETRIAAFKRSVAFKGIFVKAKQTLSRSEKNGTVKVETLKNHIKEMKTSEAPK